MRGSTQTTLQRQSSDSPRLMETTAATQSPAELPLSLCTDLMSVICTGPLQAICTPAAFPFPPFNTKQPEVL